MTFRVTVCGAALGMILSAGLTVPAAAQRTPEGRWPLQPESGASRIIAPFLEGWYDNEDGTFTMSFGYNNLNDHVVELPIGDANKLEPAKYQGMQPTTFLPGKHRGMFAITIPESERGTDVWWTIMNQNGEVTKIPGRTSWSAYQLDWRPRPHGTKPPEVSFEGSSDTGRGPPGLYAPRTLNARVGQRVEVAVNLRDVSINDPNDGRVNKGTELRINWEKYQGPVGGEVEFARHESTPPWPQPEGRGGRGGREPGPDVVPVQDQGTARLYATFSMPGQYVLLGQVDNFRRPDSASGDQCCWSNAYVRVNVTQ
jgi:hypothetical protein